ncbi:Imm44 family immunity protein [Pseudomonas purpurea]|uniref:Imm44 family immunity protein n=1 Tax=Pseudomonas purpurea TaxID=3136737 RepID=UPI003263ED88
MEFFMSAERESDIGEGERLARTKIEPVLAGLLEEAHIEADLNGWNFISVILSEKFISGFAEIAKFNKKDKELEFRLHIDHEKFKQADQKAQTSMMIDAIERSIGMMDKFKVGKNDKQTFQNALNETRKRLLD